MRDVPDAARPYKWKPGVSGNPSGRGGLYLECRSLAAEASPGAMGRLMSGPSCARSSRRPLGKGSRKRIVRRQGRDRHRHQRPVASASVAAGELGGVMEVGRGGSRHVASGDVSPTPLHPLTVELRRLLLASLTIQANPRVLPATTLEWQELPHCGHCVAQSRASACEKRSSRFLSTDRILPGDLLTGTRSLLCQGDRGYTSYGHY